ncbi:MAG: OsmC family protein [Planctomycetota bacterium]|jgi:putative redox protein
MGQNSELVVRETGEGTFTQEITVGEHTLVADEPKSVGGDDRGPNPYDFLLAALGTCTSMTLRMYARHKKLPLERVTVKLKHHRIHAKDCEDCESEKGFVDIIEREVKIEGDLTAEQRARMLEIADRCPVHRTLHSEVKVRTSPW